MPIVPEETNDSGASLQITDLEGNSSNIIDFGLVKYDGVVTPNTSRTFTTQTGWNIMSCPFLINSIVYGHNAKPGYSSNDIVASNGNYPIDEFVKNHLYEFENDTVPIHYKYENEHALGGLIGRFTILKDYLGAAYLPDFSFNGIGNFAQLEGYQYKMTNKFYWKFTGTPMYNITTGDVEVPFTLNANGWTFIAFPYLHQVDARFFFQEWVEQDLLIIAKNNQGNAYLPEWDFNGIGDLKPGEGYQVKVQNIV